MLQAHSRIELSPSADLLADPPGSNGNHSRFGKTKCTTPRNSRHRPESRRSRQTGRDLPDADGPGFVALNGGFRAENRSLIGQVGAQGTQNARPMAATPSTPDRQQCAAPQTEKMRPTGPGPLSRYSRILDLTHILDLAMMHGGYVCGFLRHAWGGRDNTP